MGFWWMGHRAPHHLFSAEVKKGDCALRVYCAHASTLRVLQHARHVCCLVISNPNRQLHTLAIEDFSRRGPQAWCHETREFLVAMDTDLVDLVEVCCSRTPWALRWCLTSRIVWIRHYSSSHKEVQRHVCQAAWWTCLKHEVFFAETLCRTKPCPVRKDLHITVVNSFLAWKLLLLQGEGQVWVQHSDFSLPDLPPFPLQTSQTILKRCWKNMVTGSNLARSLEATCIQQIKTPSKSHHVSRLIWSLAFLHPRLVPSMTACQLREDTRVA